MSKSLAMDKDPTTPEGSTQNEDPTDSDDPSSKYKIPNSYVVSGFYHSVYVSLTASAKVMLKDSCDLEIHLSWIRQEANKYTDMTPAQQLASMLSAGQPSTGPWAGRAGVDRLRAMTEHLEAEFARRAVESNHGALARRRAERAGRATRGERAAGGRRALRSGRSLWSPDSDHATVARGRAERGRRATRGGRSTRSSRGSRARPSRPRGS